MRKKRRVRKLVSNSRQLGLGGPFQAAKLMILMELPGHHGSGPLIANLFRISITTVRAAARAVLVIRCRQKTSYCR